MSNKKISELNSATNVTSNDLLQVVDVTDTSMALTGTNKKITTQTFGSSLPVIATGTTTARKLNDRFADTVNVKDFGAVGDGVTDDAPAIRQAIASNRVIIIPPGTYLLNSTVAAPPSAYDRPCILFDNISNFSVIAYGAVFQIGVSSERCGAIHFNRCDNFSFVGAKIIGNISSDFKNAGVATSSVTNFRIADLYLVNLYRQGGGTGCVGTWLVNGVFENITLKNVNVGFDHGLLYNVTYSKIRAFGCNSDGDTGVGQVGQKCFSLINDPPNALNNFTGYSFTRSKGVSYTNCYITNFATGALLSSGYGVSYLGCRFERNTGGGTAKGIGLLIYYSDVEGRFSSVGFPAGNILVEGCEFIENGSVVNGAGIFIDGSLIVNSDYIQNIAINGCVFDNNYAQGIEIKLPFSNVRNITTSGNIFWGANQTQSITPSLLSTITAVSNVHASFVSDVVLGDQLRLKNDKAVFFESDEGDSKAILGVSPTDTTYIKPVTSLGTIELKKFGGTTSFKTTEDASNPVYIFVNGSLNQVLVGAADSAGTGYRTLRIAN